MPATERRELYRRPVTYVSVKEVGADYLRDTLSSEPRSLFLPRLISTTRPPRGEKGVTRTSESSR